MNRMKRGLMALASFLPFVIPVREYEDPAFHTPDYGGYRGSGGSKINSRKKGPQKLKPAHGYTSIMEYDRAMTKWLRGGCVGPKPMRQDPLDTERYRNRGPTNAELAAKRPAGKSRLADAM